MASGRSAKSGSPVAAPWRSAVAKTARAMSWQTPKGRTGRHGRVDADGQGQVRADRDRRRWTEIDNRTDGDRRRLEQDRE
eukprot:8628579-Alexandrium_andersonii.AAC.1